MNEILELLKEIKQRLDRMEAINEGRIIPSPTQPTNKKYYTIVEAATYLSCSVSGVRYKIKRGQLRANTNGKKILLKVSDIDSYMRNLNT